MPTLIRQRRVNEVWKKPGEMVQIPYNGWTYRPYLYLVTQALYMVMTGFGTTPSCKNTNLTGI